MINNKTVTGIILAAGNSTRFGGEYNKNFSQINEKPILLYSLEVFNRNEFIDNILIAIKKDEIDLVEKIIKKIVLNKKVELVIGGSTRQESVYNCIRRTNSNIVIIHDGARPVIKQKYINECIKNMESYKGVTIGVKSKDTIKITDDNGIVISTTNRRNTWNIQTPQCFDREVLLNAHQKMKNDDTITDDCMLLEKKQYQIKIIEGEYSNIKVTTVEDMQAIKEYL